MAQLPECTKCGDYVGHGPCLCGRHADELKAEVRRLREERTHQLAMAKWSSQENVRLRAIEDAARMLEDAVASFDGEDFHNTVLVPESAWDSFTVILEAKR